MGYIIFGILLLLLTFYEYIREEADSLLLFDFFLDWFLPFDFSRTNSPLCYWMILISQAIIGLFLIAIGVVDSIV